MGAVLEKAGFQPEKVTAPIWEKYMLSWETTEPEKCIAKLVKDSTKRQNITVTKKSAPGLKNSFRKPSKITATAM